MERRKVSIEVNDRVRWAGVQDPRCAPGFNGTVLAIARKDNNSLKVAWDERGHNPLLNYTWERRKNLRPAEDDGLAGVVAKLN